MLIEPLAVCCSVGIAQRRCFGASKRYGPPSGMDFWHSWAGEDFSEGESEAVG